LLYVVSAHARCGGKMNISYATILILVGALSFTGWKLNSVTDELNAMKVEIGIQDKRAQDQQTKFKENQIELTKKYDDRIARITANRLLRDTKNTATASPTSDSAEVADEGLTPIGKGTITGGFEAVKIGFRDQCVDVANQLEGLKEYVFVNKIPISD